MAYNPYREFDAANPFGNKPERRAVLLSEATEDDMRIFYKEWNKLKEEFEENRPAVYITHGTFHNDPLLADYKYFLIKKGFISIGIKV